MKHYIDLTLLPDPDIHLNFLWQKVFKQMHIALVENKNLQGHSDIGFSWPRYRYDKSLVTLGNKLRVFAASEKLLEALDLTKWLNKFQDNVHITTVRTVPETVSHVRFSRKAVKGKQRIERVQQQKAKRWMEKSGLSLEECITRLEKTKPQVGSCLPFIWLDSEQTKRNSNNRSSKFCLFIAREPCEKPEEGNFSCYGLSNSATVPWFE